MSICRCTCDTGHRLYESDGHLWSILCQLVCFVERFVNGHAENLYTLGCRSKTAIACLVTPHSVGRRSGGQCGACCTGRNCQQKLCGLSGNDTTLSCRYCNYLVPGLSSCPTHTTCDPTEACKTAIHVIGGVIRYEYGCEQKHLCAAFLSSDIRNFNNERVTICSACCVTNNCNENDDCYTLHHSMTQDMFTSTPGY
ncbi:uncharacterized protein [Argopecten irradians]|uniref:uncharacterized protein isoform X2 n=1 Tax=Argopecten irradians TaxID=31199 RepID=UPI003712DFD4